MALDFYLQAYEGLLNRYRMKKIGLPTSRTVLEMTGLKNSETNFSIFKTKENSGLPLF